MIKFDCTLRNYSRPRRLNRSLIRGRPKTECRRTSDPEIEGKSGEKISGLRRLDVMEKRERNKNNETKQ